MTTLLQACKEIVNNSVDGEYEPDQTMADIYQAQYGNWADDNPSACTEYLRGLPSVCTVPFSNYDILQLLAAKGITRKSDNAQQKLIDDYWATCGYAFYQLIK